MDAFADPGHTWRTRARHLEAVAAQLEGSLAMTMHCRADDTVWRGAWAVACRNDLESVATGVARVVQSLRAEAVVCRQHAVSLEWPP
jgi:hypothetical protein